MVLVDALWLIRLARLFRQRGYALWLGLLVALAIATGAAAMIFSVPHEGRSFLAVAIEAAMAILFLVGIAYLAVDRWLPPRRRSAAPLSATAT
jgi:hypothetical protein